MSKASVHFPRPAVLSFVPVALLGLLMMASAVAGSAASRSLATAPDITMPTAEEWRRLRDGEVLVAGRSAPGPEGEVTVRALFRGDAEQPWQLLGDCRSNYRFVPGLEYCELLRDEPTTAITRFVHKAAWYLPRVDFTFETARQPLEWIRVRLVDGDLEEMEGSWRFDPLSPGGEVAGFPSRNPGAGDSGSRAQARVTTDDERPYLLVTHRMRVRPGVMAPRWLVRRTLERDSANLLHCLRWLSNASPDLARAHEDRTGCQPPPEA